MATQIVVPQLGESIVEATVGQWLKQEGDRVAAGEAVVKLETDKVDLEVGAERGGVLAHIEREAGEDVQVGDVLGTIEESEAAEAVTPKQPPAQTQAEPAPAAAAPEKEPVEKVTPVARRVAEDLGVDLAQVRGTGPGGRITREDVESQQEGTGQRSVETAPAPTAPAAAPQPQPAAQRQVAAAPVTQPMPEPNGRREERVRLSRRRQTIARRLVEAQHAAAMLTTFNEVDMSAIVEIRTRRKQSFTEQYGVGLGFMSFFVKASVAALKAFPRVNAEIQGDEILYKYYYDIGIAVGAEEGLVVPVLRDADRMSFAEIEREVKAFAKRARDSTLSLEDLRGGTFSITNGGVFGSLLSTPIINPPQVAILGMHKIEQRPVAVDGQVVIRPMMYVAMSYDHRVIDGREAVQFLVRVKQLIEDPESLMLAG